MPREDYRSLPVAGTSKPSSKLVVGGRKRCGRQAVRKKSKLNTDEVIRRPSTILRHISRSLNFPAFPQVATRPLESLEETPTPSPSLLSFLRWTNTRCSWISFIHLVIPAVPVPASDRPEFPALPPVLYAVLNIFSHSPLVGVDRKRYPARLH